jgi:hypothetical protein
MEMGSYSDLTYYIVKRLVFKVRVPDLISTLQVQIKGGRSPRPGIGLPPEILQFPFRYPSVEDARILKFLEILGSNDYHHVHSAKLFTIDPANA